jgi:deoxyribonuclease V
VPQVRQARVPAARLVFQLQGTEQVLTAWPATIAELEAVQLELSRRRGQQPAWQPGSSLRPGGVFAAPLRGPVALGAAGDPGWAAAVVFEDGRLLVSKVLEGRFAAAYEPSYLALREGALLERTVRALPIWPDVLLVNATGLDHPRRAGLAIHLGAVLGLPTIGVTERRLTGGGEEDVARLLGTKARARPLVVHPGWRTDLETAVQVVQRLCLLARTPEPLREARRLARTARWTS